MTEHSEMDYPTTQKKMLTCQKCDNTFVNEKDLRNHIEAAHSSTFFCPHCEKSFKNRELLNSHVEKEHNTDLFETTFFNPSASH